MIYFREASPWWGGAESCFTAILRASERMDVRYHVLHDMQHNHQQRFKISSINRSILVRPPLDMLLRANNRGLRGTDRLCRLMRLHALRRLETGNIRVVHYNLLRSGNLDEIIFWHSRGVKVVGHVLGLVPRDAGDAVFNACDLVVCVSQAVAAGVSRIAPRATVEVFYDGAVIDNQSPSIEDNCLRQIMVKNRPIILMPAVLEPRKGHETAIRAMRELAIGQSAHLVIAGGPSARWPKHPQKLRNLLKSLGLENFVTFVGHISDLSSYYQASRLVLSIADDGEAFGLTPIEAAVYEKPSIVTDLGAARELIVHGETGLLVPPHDPHAIVLAVRWMMENPDRAIHMGEAARVRTLQHFDLRRNAEQLISRLVKLTLKA